MLEECKPLRFKMGDKVELNLGDNLWKKGEIVKPLWANGFPYTINITDALPDGRRNVEVFAPVNS